MKLFSVVFLLLSMSADAAQIDGIAASKSEIYVVASRTTNGVPESYLASVNPQTGAVIIRGRLPIDSTVTGLTVLSDGNLFMVHQEMSVPPSVAGFTVIDAKSAEEKAKGVTDCSSYKSLDISGSQVSVVCMVDDPTSVDLKPSRKSFPFDQKLTIQSVKNFKPLTSKVSAQGQAADVKGEYPWSELHLGGKLAKVLKAEEFFPK
jgi:hypothetical protein